MSDDEKTLAFAVADRIAVDAKGYCWRTWHDEDYYSMCPVNPDNSPIPQPVTWFVPESEIQRLRAGLAVRDEALAEIAALHRTWYEINGKRIDLHVYVSEPPEGHVCLKPGDSQYSDVCDAESDEHYVLACTECRASTDEGEPGYRPWPCDTQRILANLQRSLDPYRDDKERISNEAV